MGFRLVPKSVSQSQGLFAIAKLLVLLEELCIIHTLRAVTAVYIHYRYSRQFTGIVQRRVKAISQHSGMRRDTMLVVNGQLNPRLDITPFVCKAGQKPFVVNFQGYENPAVCKSSYVCHTV